MSKWGCLEAKSWFSFEAAFDETLFLVFATVVSLDVGAAVVFFRCASLRFFATSSSFLWASC
jgi:hypothetical protein